MRHARSRFKHEAHDAAHRNMGAYARLIHHDKRAVENIQIPFLDKQYGNPILYGDRLKRGENGFGHYCFPFSLFLLSGSVR